MAAEPTNPNPTPEPAKPADPPAKPDPKAPPPADDKVTLSRAELQQQIDAAVAERDRKAEAKAKKEREDAEAKAAAERGEWQKVAEKAQAELDRVAGELRNRDLAGRVRDYLAEHHAGYVADPKAHPETYVLPLLAGLPADAAPEDVTKAVKTAAEQYVKDNPRATPPASGAPAAPQRAAKPAAGQLPAVPSDANGSRRPFSHLSFRG